MSAVLLLSLLLATTPVAVAAVAPCNGGVVFEDRDGDGQRDGDEPGLPGIRVSDGRRIVVTDAQGRYRLPVESGRTTFVVKPAGYAFATRRDGLPDFWRHVQTGPGPALKFGGLPVEPAACRDFALRPQAAGEGALEVLLFGDPQPKDHVEVDYFWRDIVQPLVGQAGAQLGLTLGDVVDDDLSLLGDVKRTTVSLGVPWLHVAGNHDIDLDAATDDDSLRTFRREFGPDTFAWEEAQAVFVGLDDVVHQPGGNPAYIGGLREDQFAFLQAYLPTVPRDRLLVVFAHIPFFDAKPDRETFRRVDRERLFALLKDFPRVLLLSAHTHAQRHHFHDATHGWHGAAPLHEYNVGAACGGFWGGVPDAAGLPAATMADGTPNGYARLRIDTNGDYALRWFGARAAADEAIALHLPNVLRRGSYPAVGLFANVFMGMDGDRVEFRIDGGDWRPMQRVERSDPRVVAENLADDLAEALRAFTRVPEAVASSHLWRATLPTDLAAGDHRVEVRAFDRWRGELRAAGSYTLVDAAR